MAASPCLRQSSVSKLQGMCTHLPTYLCGKHKYNSQINIKRAVKNTNTIPMKSTTLFHKLGGWLTGHKSYPHQLCRESEACNIHLSPPKTPFPLIGAKRMLWGCWQWQGAWVTFSRAHTDWLLRSPIRQQQRFQRQSHKVLKYLLKSDSLDRTYLT